MNKILFAWLLFLASAFVSSLASNVASAAQAEDQFLTVDQAFTVRFLQDSTAYYVQFDIAPEHYLYKDSVMIKIDGQAVDLAANIFSDNAISKFDAILYNKEIDLFYDFMALTIPQQAGNELTVRYQGCAEAGLCYPPKTQKFAINGAGGAKNSTKFGLGANTFTENNLTQSNLVEVTSKQKLNDAPDVDKTPNQQPVEQAIAVDETSNSGLLLTMFLAMVGGVILNLMPCVFPVLSLKAMQLAQLNGQRKTVLLHSWVYTLGVILSFIVIAAALLVLRSFGEAIGWGFQFQSPYFVVALMFIFFLLALSMAGFFEIGQGVMGMGQNLTQKSGTTGAFFTGVLATVVATPCTAPFMGSAIALALSQPAWWAILIFSSMGLGLALPILLLSYIPTLQRLMPRPGAWMDGFKQAMSFPLFATVIWLLWVLVQQVGADAIIASGSALILLAIAVWPQLKRKHKEAMGYSIFKSGLRLIALMAAIYMVVGLADKKDSIWQTYSPTLLQGYLDDDKTVFIDVTAAWCITCKANENVALSGSAFEALVAKEQVMLLKADWTNEDPMITELLAKYNRSSVPLYVVYKPNQPVQLLPQLLTPAIVEAALISQ